MIFNYQWVIKKCSPAVTGFIIAITGKYHKMFIEIFPVGTIRLV